jgi:hypothetical protein
MADFILKPMEDNVFLVCDDVRNEVEGKKILVGVYPQNTILLRLLPGDVTFMPYTAVIPTRTGDFAGTFRILDPEGAIAYTTEISGTVSLADASMNVSPRVSFKATMPGIFSAQVGAGAGSWITLGRFTIAKMKSAL